jgi:hypothetical protein
LKAVVAIVAAVTFIWGMVATGLLPGEARDRRIAEQHAADVAAGLATVNRLAAAVRKTASEPDVERDVAALVAAARAAEETGDDAKLHQLAAKLRSIQEELELEYTLSIANPAAEGGSATQRNFTDERGTRSSGFYLLVEARDANGNAVTVPIENRETGRIERVSRWGEQAPEEVFDRLAADKQQDGVLDERTFGVKRRGVRRLEVTLPGADGAPLTRQGQITSW